MSYLVLARKWRPMDFKDLIGQDHVAQTLANAIASNRVAHAFLFTGVRGVGKTTSARILAKALNCMRPPESRPAASDPGPTATPCLLCAACKEIAVGSDMDVQEIDGASYNGVDEVRRLQDSLPYRPSRDRYKIVIVDEVHMLSQNAWNAFLKTLEEPPPHVKFIFATTEVQKVPVTILSRVQRFDFKLIGTQEITGRLRYVLGEEGVAADDAALSIIAREAAGSMRDAMSLLDQVIAWGNDRLTETIVSQVLGVASRTVLHQIARALVSGDPVSCLEIVATLAAQGFDMAHVARDLLSLLRDLVVASVCSDPGTLIDTPEEERRDVLELARSGAPDDLIRLHQGFSRAFDDVVRSGQPRAAFEMLLVRLSRRPPLLPINDLVERLVAVERRLGGSFPAPPAGAGRAPHSSDQGARRTEHRPQGREPSSQHAPRPARDPNSDSEEPPPPPTLAQAPPIKPLEVTVPRLSAHIEATRMAGVAAESPSPLARSPEPFSSVEPLASTGLHSPRTEHDVPANSSAAATGGFASLMDEQHDSAARSEGADEEKPLPRDEHSRTLPDWAHRKPLNAEALDLYERIVSVLREPEPQLAALLAHAVPVAASLEELHLGWEPGHPLASTACSSSNLELLAKAAADILSAAPKVKISLDFEPARTATTLASLAAAARDAATKEARQKARNHPLVKEAIEVLGAKLREIRLPD